MSTYQELLREHYVQKRKRHPDFSLRAFARQIGLTPGGLSRLFHGKMSLSLARSLEVAEKLGFNEKETENFINLVQLEKAKSSETKDKILKKIGRTQGTPMFELGVDHFKVISEWYPMAMLKIASCSKLDRTVSGMAKRLGLTTVEVAQAADRLKRLELIEEDQDGHLKRVPDSEVVINFSKDHDAGRKYYSDLIQRLHHHLEKETSQTRSMGAKVLLIDESQLEAVRKLTDEYHERLGEISDQSKKKEKVYQAFSSVFEIKGK